LVDSIQLDVMGVGVERTFSPKISPWSRWMTFGLRRAKMLGSLFAQLVSKIFNLCGHDPPTSQTDRRHAISRPRFAL